VYWMDKCLNAEWLCGKVILKWNTILNVLPCVTTPVSIVSTQCNKYCDNCMSTAVLHFQWPVAVVIRVALIKCSTRFTWRIINVGGVLHNDTSPHSVIYFFYTWSERNKCMKTFQSALIILETYFKSQV
jgi:hypothetical protein